MTRSFPARPLLLASASLLLACSDPAPAPAPAAEPTPLAAPSPAAPSPAATPAAAATPAPAPKPQAEDWRVTQRERGLLVRDPATGFSCTTPGQAKRELGGGRGPHAYQLRLRLVEHAWSVRVRRDEAPPGATPRQRAETLLMARALAKPQELAAFRPGEVERWGVDAAVAAVYPLGDGEVWERVLTLVKGEQALVLWETVALQLGRPLVTELGSLFHASFRWGGEPRELQYVPSPYVDTSMRLRKLGQARVQALSAAVPAAELERAAQLLGGVAFSTADPPDDPLGDTARQLISERVEQLGGESARLIGAELKQQVATYRDLRGLQLVLDAAASAAR